MKREENNHAESTNRKPAKPTWKQQRMWFFVKWQTRPDTRKRDALLKELVSQRLSIDVMLKITERLEGKSQEEKERIAGQLLDDLERGKLKY